LCDATVAVVIFSPHPGTFDFHIFDRNAGGFQSVVFGFGQFLPLPVAATEGDVDRVFDVLFPALAEQGAAEAVVLGLGEQFVSLEVAGAGAVDHNPVGELAIGMMGGQCRNQFAIPVSRVLIVEFSRAGAAKENS